MHPVLDQLRLRFPYLTYTSGSSFAWSPATREIIYGNPDGPHAIWSLLHETSHALLAHTTYATDLDLLMLEAAAWKHAEELAGSMKIVIDADHIQNALDTYRDWLHARSSCPRCNNSGFQHRQNYQCFNCHTTWHVTNARFCRPYRTRQRSPSATLPFVSP